MRMWEVALIYLCSEMTPYETAKPQYDWILALNYGTSQESAEDAATCWWDIKKNPHLDC